MLVRSLAFHADLLRCRHAFLCRKGTERGFQAGLLLKNFCVGGYSFAAWATSINRSDWFYCIAHVFLVLIGLCLFSLLLFAKLFCKANPLANVTAPLPSLHNTTPPSPWKPIHGLKLFIYCLQRYSVILCLKLLF